jgi:hypothetical protein
MKEILFAAAAAITLVASVRASAHEYMGSESGGAGLQRDVPAIVLAVKDDTGRGGIDIGPLGQCFDPRACGDKRDDAYASCSLVRERIVTPNGHVTYRRHRVCN